MAGVVDAAAASTESVPIAPSSVKLLVHAHDAVPNYVRLCLYAGGKTTTSSSASSPHRSPACATH